MSFRIRDEARTIVRLAVPIAIAQFGLTTIGLVDVAVLGHASAVDLAGVSIGRSINFAGIAAGIGVSEALEPLAAQAIGAGDPLEAWRALLATLVTAIMVWIPCSILAVVSTYFLAPLGIEPDLIETARTFLIPSLPAMLLFCVFLTVKSFLQAHERTKPALIASVVANVVNVVACNLLIRGDDALTTIHLPKMGFPHLGAFGAGIASSLSAAVLAGWVLVSAWRLRPVTTSPFARLRHLPIMKVLAMGTPIALQLFTEIGVISVVGVLAGRLGRVAVGAHQIALGLESFTFMGALGISSAASVRVGHAIGEGRSPRSSGFISIVLGVLFMGAMGLLLLVLRHPLVAVFTESEDVIDVGVGLLVLAAAAQLFDGAQCVTGGALRGAGDVKFSFVLNFLAHWFVGFPLALWFGFHMGLGVFGLWMGLLIGLAVVAVGLLWRFNALSKNQIARL